MSQPSLKDLQEKLRSLGATEEAETAEAVAIEPQDRTFQKVMFGAGIEEEIETKPFIQPENPPYTDPENFTIGTKDHHGWYEQALPYPRWPRPGEISTDDERADHEAAVALWMELSQALTKYLRYRPSEDMTWQYRWGSGDLGSRLDTDWARLKGIWESRGMAARPVNKSYWTSKQGRQAGSETEREVLPAPRRTVDTYPNTNVGTGTVEGTGPDSKQADNEGTVQAVLQVGRVAKGTRSAGNRQD